MYQTRLKSFLQIAFKSKVKVTLLFLISLGIPSVFLLFLALRGIEYDRALSEQRLLARHQGIADSLVALVDNEISVIENQLVNLFTDETNYSDGDLSDKGSRIDSLELIDELFLFRGNELIYPEASLLYGVDAAHASGRIQNRPVELERIIDDAEKNEFRLENYTRAAELYRSALEITHSSDVRADLLMRLARLYSRMGAPQRAEATLETIAERHGDNRLPGGMPAGLAARLQIAGIGLRARDSVEAGDELVQLYRDLLSGAWILERSQFRFARNRIESQAAELANSDVQRAIDPLADKADSLTFRTDYLLDVGSAARAIIFDSTAAHEDSTISCHRFLVAGSDERTMLLIVRYAASYRGNVTAAGVIINQSEFAARALPKLVENVSPEENATLMVMSESNRAIFGDSPPSTARLTVSSAFEGGFPPWTIALYQNDPHFFERLISGRQSFYIYVLITVMLVMVFGAIMTARMMSRELELARMKSDFVSTVSHEFRSPLTSIRQLSEMLQSGRISSDERRQQYYDVILEQSERLSLLVNNVLDLARIDEKRFTLEYEQIDLKELLNTIVERARAQTGDAVISIAVNIDDSLPVMTADPGAITHIMNNLIDNAIKYSRESPDISVAAYVDGNDIVIDVTDKGIGIPKSEVGKVFERFYRVGDELTRKVKGSGLGLALVRELVLAHGGNIKLSSEPKKGSTFTISLPYVIDKEDKRG